VQNDRVDGGDASQDEVFDVSERYTGYSFTYSVLRGTDKAAAVRFATGQVASKEALMFVISPFYFFGGAGLKGNQEFPISTRQGLIAVVQIEFGLGPIIR